MGRRIASQVHKAATRLLQGQLQKQEPLWYSAVAQFPPIPLPPRAPVKRTEYDLPPRGPADAPKRQSLKMMPVFYLEDRIRHRFFKDHPFEALRPKSLSETAQVAQEHPVRGKQWTRLRQRGRNPDPEDAIRFTMNLHVEHGLPLTHAYHAAVLQYRALRAEHKTMSQFAVLEAESYGATFTPGELVRGFNLEQAALKTWDPTATRDLSVLRARKKWRPVVDKAPEQFTEGHEYVEAYQQGVVPTYREGTAESYVFRMPGEDEPVENSTVPPQP